MPGDKYGTATVSYATLDQGAPGEQFFFAVPNLSVFAQHKRGMQQPNIALLLLDCILRLGILFDDLTGCASTCP